MQVAVFRTRSFDRRFPLTGRGTGRACANMIAA